MIKINHLYKGDYYMKKYIRSETELPKNMPAIIESTMRSVDTDEEIRRANSILHQISNVVENAFSEFDIEWEFRPMNIDRRNIDDEPYIQRISLNIIIGGIIFKFKVNISNPFTNRFVAPEVRFEFGGYEPRISQITPQVASSILAASKIAQRLKKEITQVLKEYGE